MSMTKKIRPVDANNLARRIREYMDNFPNATTRLATCRVILSMLGDETQTPTLRPITREQVENVWKGCKRCAATKDEAFNPGIAHNFSVFDDAIYYCDSDYGWEGESILFCPWCGMPLTDEAVDMVMEKLEALK